MREINLNVSFHNFKSRVVTMLYNFFLMLLVTLTLAAHTEYAAADRVGLQNQANAKTYTTDKVQYPQVGFWSISR